MMAYKQRTAIARTTKRTVCSLHS